MNSKRNLPPACSFTTSVKESYSHPYDQVTEEPCSDPRTSYRCPRHRSLPVWTHFLFLAMSVLLVVGRSFLPDCVVPTAGSPTRRPTGRQWRPTTARGTSAARDTMKAETSVSVSNRGTLGGNQIHWIWRRFDVSMIRRSAAVMSILKTKHFSDGTWEGIHLAHLVCLWPDQCLFTNKRHNQCAWTWSGKRQK